MTLQTSTASALDTLTENVHVRESAQYVSGVK
jgi:hypothetical protein